MSQPREIMIVPIESPGAEIRGTTYGVIQIPTTMGKPVTRGDRGSEGS